LAQDDVAQSVVSFVLVLLRSLASALRSRKHLALENLALGQQLALLRHRSKWPRFSAADRIFGAWLSRNWPAWRDALCLLRPATPSAGVTRASASSGPGNRGPAGQGARRLSPSLVT
jgi:hypothetical protein